MKRSEIILMVLHVPLDFLLLILSGISAYYLRFSDLIIGWRPVIFNLSLNEFLNLAGFVALIWILIFAFSGLYSTDPNRKFSQELTRVFLACSTGLGAIALYILFSHQLFDSRFLVAAGYIFAIIYIIFGRLMMRGLKGVLYRMGIGLRRVVVIGPESISGAIIKALKSRRELGYSVVANFNKFSDFLKNEVNIDELIFTNPRGNEKEALTAIDYCDEKHKIFKYSADLFSTYSSNIAVNPLAGIPIVELKKTPLEAWGRVTKRLFDILVSLLMIVLSSPILIISSICILLETGRPIIYKNERVCIRGKKFFAYKFRSMRQKDCTGVQFGELGLKAQEKEKDLIKTNSLKTGPVYKISNDPRVTKFGRFIRRWSIDELPQFFNVLKGEMSIVGPRPHQPREVDLYEKQYKKVLILKPGITGLAQISGRSDLSFEDEMKLDIYYIEKWSLLLDLIIFIKTPFVVLRRKGAI